jgi:probable phosphoglycerate mutase
MSRLFLIRHGETDWNRQRKLQGHTDIPLNERGRQQAQGLISLFEQLKPDHIVSSDLERAQQTARIAHPNLAISTTPLLREINLGEAEGLLREEIQEKWGPELWQGWSDTRFSSYDVRFPAGESRREGLSRLFDLLNDHRPHFAAGKRVGWFTHGLLLRSFAQWCSNLEEPRYTTPNCCVYEWDWRGAEPLHFDLKPEHRPRLRQIYLLADESLSL